MGLDKQAKMSVEKMQMDGSKNNGQCKGESEIECIRIMHG